MASNYQQHPELGIIENANECQEKKKNPEKYPLKNSLIFWELHLQNSYRYLFIIISRSMSTDLASQNKINNLQLFKSVLWYFFNMLHSAGKQK